MFTCVTVREAAYCPAFSRMKSSGLSALGRRSEAPPNSWLMEQALARPRLISLAAGFTDNETLPVRLTRELLNGLLRTRKTGAPALQYGTTAGDPGGS